MARKLVFDIETKNIFEEVGSSDPADLDIACVCAYEYDTDTYHSWTEENLEDMWEVLSRTDILIGYNSDHFDIPLLNKYYPGDLRDIKSVDLMKEIKGSLGRRIKLDDVASATLGTSKSANGLQAVTWWRQGEKQKVIDYCIQDVKVTKDLYDYAHENAEVNYEKDGEKISLPLENVQDWEEIESGDNTLSLF